jgi:hypothetical protein
MPQITITISDSDAQAMSFVSASAQHWLDDAITARASSATEEIVRICVDRCLATGTSIPNTKAGMVELAFQQGWIKTLQQQEAEAAAEAAARLGQDETNTNV